MNLFTCGVTKEIESLRQSSYTTLIHIHGREKSPKDHTHQLDFVTEAVLYQNSVSTSVAVLMEDQVLMRDRIVVIYVNLTSRIVPGEFCDGGAGGPGRIVHAG